MGTRSQCWALAGILMALLSAQLAAQPKNEPSRTTVIIPPISMSPTMSSLNLAHNGRVCSTWGDFHYKTFDGDIFRFPGLCNYVLASHCRAAYEDFNIQLRRRLVGDRSTISHVVLKVDGLVLELANGSVFVDGQRKELPYSRAGLLVEHSNKYVKINIRMVLTFFWNRDDSALLELDTKYANQTCGLCGDFNGLPGINEFYAHNVRLTELQFGNLQKLDGPTELCQDPLPTLANNCTNVKEVCYRILLGAAFAQCNTLVDPKPYLTSCVQDLCLCPSCPCATFTEYSRQCAHAGGQPQNWRGPNLCPQTCPDGMQHEECGSPCVDTCSNPERGQLCEDHCEDGCFCPKGMVLDDITHTGCVPLSQCPCTYQGHTYTPGATVTTSCSSCTCTGGRWQCAALPCPGTCFVQGGAHISTYDEKLYNLHGDCSYILSKRCADSSFTVLAELRRCGLTDTESCLKSVTLSLHGGDTTLRIQANGAVFMNSIYAQLPMSAANITVFKPSSFFVLVQTGLGLQLQVQLVPLMQIYIRLDPIHQDQMCGLCGNFNQNQADDFTALSGVVEGTGAAFANTWKTQASCPNAKNSFEDPCSLSVENEKYARHWCALLTDPAGAFATCHSIVNPTPFHSNCMFDTCNCEKSEDCLCAALSAYVRACAAKGVLLRGWRDRVCAKYASSCPKSQSYEYVVATCQPTCRSLSEADVTCRVSFVPVDGCTCPVGSFLDDSNICVPEAECPCYLHGTAVAPGEVVHENGMVCSCFKGKLSCLGALVRNNTACVPPMVYMDCSNARVGTPGAECLRSCHTLDIDCYSTRCVSGCVCPSGLVSDGRGGCIAQEDCPCIHNEATYQPGATIRVDCNTCTCKNRRWECSSQPCLGTCVAYGDGHFITFDGDRYNFEGNCEYMLAQDYCGGSSTTNGTFRIVTENIPCGTTGVTCSKAIKVFLERFELILTEGHLKVVEWIPGQDLPYKMRYMGIFMVIETHSGLVLSWDRKTSIFIRLHPKYKGKVCGLCGNFDGNAINDFTTRSLSVVGDVLEFGNSWKFSPSCPDALAPKDPCTTNPYRKSWAQKQCSILHSATFAACQSQVDSTKYYEACVSDACACDSGGDCECFCTAVAAYAQACQDAGVCVSWRSPDVCPLFCDYYNPHGECEWHYQPCGAPCMRTCRNPSGHCLLDLPGLEGCYPRCPPNKPFFSEDQMKCVAQCGCYDDNGNYYEVNGKVTTTENCQNCTCTTSGIQCHYSIEACTCTYEGKTYGYEEVIYNTTDGLGACLVAICGGNGTIHRNTVECPGTPSTKPPFTFTTTVAPQSTAGSTPAPTSSSTVCVQEVCIWSSWYDGSQPEPGLGGGDIETFENLKQKGYQVCTAPADIECQAESFPNIPLEKLGQKVFCDRVRGLICLNREQSPPLCHNYKLRVLCCQFEPCGRATTLLTSTPPTVVTCTLQEGLICRNEDQQGRFHMCFNYNVRVLCCDDYQHCRSTLGPTATSRSTSTTVGPRTSPMPTTAMPMGSTSPHSSTRASTPTLGSTISSQTSTHGPVSMTVTSPTKCEPQCTWTDWMDESYPLPLDSGGDFETYTNLRDAGMVFCDSPVDIQCRSELKPDLPLEALDQVVQCSAAFGLICKNEEQRGTPKYCHNFHIRVLCCDYNMCSTTPSTTVVSYPGSSTSTLAAFSSPGTMVPSSASPSPSATYTPYPSGCQPACYWTGWLDISKPEPGRFGGDKEIYYEIRNAGHGLCKVPTAIQCEAVLYPGVALETLGQKVYCSVKFGLICRNKQQKKGQMCLNYHTFDNIRAAGGKMCPKPEKIECRAENYPEVSLDQIGQVVTCTLQEGLICRNEDQQGRFHMCFNYNVRVLCCDDYQHCRSTLGPTATSRSTSTTVGPRTSPMSTTSMPMGATSPQSRTRASTPTLGSTLSSQSSTPGPVSMTLATSPTKCEPQCTWTDWMDESYPVPGAAGGDFETYDKLRMTGKSFCDNPVDIQCRSELQPGTPLEALDQVVECNVTFGLICRNQEQRGTTKYCHNFHIRNHNHTISPNTRDKWQHHINPNTCDRQNHNHTISPDTRDKRQHHINPNTYKRQHHINPNTCDKRQHHISPNTCDRQNHSYTINPNTSDHRPTSSASLTSITRCYCQAFGELFSPVLPGDIIYNKTDMAGCHFYAVCNEHCDIDRFQDACTTVLPPASSVAPSSVPVTMPSPSPTPGCDHTVPPRQVNETWTLPDCTVARCEGNNHIVLLEPKPVANVTCANQHPPVKVQNQSDPCDYHYECECICTGWGESHYTTFDGTSYSFMDNCTYVLLREIHPRLSNLSVLIDNYYCTAPEGVPSCARALLINYLSVQVVFTVTDNGGTMESLILFNGTRVGQSFGKNGMNISETTGGTMNVDIPAIGAQITFDGRLFQIRLSYSQFNHNTEGQCGTCTNTRVDDCRRPDGTIAPTCEGMAPFWVVPNISREGCMGPTSPPPSTSPQPRVSTATPESVLPTGSTSSTGSTSCSPSPLCAMILSPTFAECHEFIPPNEFYSACVSDSCQGGPVPCESLEVYASLCRIQGVCINWRNATDGLCDFTCPPTQVYKPCGPMTPETCDMYVQGIVVPGLAEGCFCPDGEILFNKHTKICVPECPCVGPDGYPKFPGEQWISNCQTCECKNPKTVHCRPVECEVPTEEPKVCSEPGFVTVTQPQPDNPCCPKTLCVCNPTTCPKDLPSCEPGLEPVPVEKAGSCCPTFSCRPQLCLYNGTFYGVGATFPGDVPCHTCTCLSTHDSTPTVKCEETVCDITCSQGFEHRKVAGQCCDDCVQVACLTPDGQPVKPNHTWVNSHLDECTTYLCEVVNQSFVLVPRPTSCPEVSTCMGVLKKTDCCYSCDNVDRCQVRIKKTVLSQGDCETVGTVNLTFCEGFCPGLSKYSEQGEVQRHCTCCQEIRKHEESVSMSCPDGSQIEHTFIQVDECSCNPWCLDKPAPSHYLELEDNYD
ncbi:PREDICTED: mucin-5B [Elephantulus edwardii]|uniref:mucin-5B n=1 Tax=Elephantulus edwardii TaxID=28737 RepID=UPI0003F0CB58|nr:PREDICTED: mucin-5B [Elephantulus edwardii]